MSQSSGSFAQEAQALTRGQLLDLLLEIEERLKLLIRAVFKRESDDWGLLVPESIRDELIQSPSSAATAIGPQSDLLDRATLKQLIGIVLARWRMFQPILSDKAWLQSRLEELREARNALVHGYQPDADYKVKVAFTVSELGKRIPLATQSQPVGPSGSVPRALEGRAILWVDDQPVSNLWARRLLAGFGADVVPVLSNDEAVGEASKRRFDVVVSDIDRGDGEPGSKLGVRMKAIGIETPLVFFLARLDPSLGVPFGGVAISNDMVSMLTSVLSLLRPDAVVNEKR